MSLSISSRGVAVLDTNVVLDWLWFDDPRVHALGARVRAGSLAWLGTAAMRDELASVLGRGCLPPRARSATDVLTDFDRWCRPHAAPPPVTAAALRCADGDDQKFIDLGLALAGSGGAALLLTRDRAVLRLTRRARAQGLWIGPPERWRDPTDPNPG